MLLVPRVVKGASVIDAERGSAKRWDRRIPSIDLRVHRDGTCAGDPAEPQVRFNHVHDLERIQEDLSRWRVDAKNLARSNVVVALLVFLIRSFRNVVWTLLLAPATTFTDPLGTLSAVTV